MALVIHELKDGRAVLGSNTSDTVFGPTFSSFGHAEDFCDWLKRRMGVTDARKLTTPEIGMTVRDAHLLDAYADWYDSRIDPETDAIKDED